ncbi:MULTISPECIES: hypothetical protein [unclassified Exiguobacterium]|uniref:hypothetical protein n=1 Tax=unclassified Exiguobacterium TaxID=2644629 RepID=UPI000B59024A|nr:MULTISPECIES: hypothetical protein [unclassified Exiguobacterium]ASI36569.1 hypothetical protein A0126_13540 [Exiguobacterium sp. N4-1P]
MEQTLREERLQALTVAYIEKNQLQNKSWVIAALMATAGTFTEIFSTTMYLSLLPLVFLVFDLPFRLEKRKILARYLSSDQVMNQSLLWLGIQFVLYGSLYTVILETKEMSIWKIALWMLIILAPVYYVTDWLFKKIARSGDPDFVSDKEIHANVKEVEE